MNSALKFNEMLQKFRFISQQQSKRLFLFPLKTRKIQKSIIGPTLFLPSSVGQFVRNNPNFFWALSTHINKLCKLTKKIQT